MASATPVTSPPLWLWRSVLGSPRNVRAERSCNTIMLPLVHRECCEVLEAQVCSHLLMCPLGEPGLAPSGG